MKILVTVESFGKVDKTAVEMLKKYDVVYGDVNQKLSKKQLIFLLRKENPEIVIAGTEKYDGEVLNNAPNLKLISRVGIGIDSIDLEECYTRGIEIRNTPDAPSNAIADLTIYYILEALRKPNMMDKHMREGKWDRYIGREISECFIGIIGYGRIGKLVSERLRAFKPQQIYVNDTDSHILQEIKGNEFKSLDEILEKSDVVTLHIPLTKKNKDFISYKEMDLMKKDAILINTSRGGLVNEEALYNWLSKNPEAYAAVDVFEQEPYSGKLIELSNCILTPHAGSYTIKSRRDMEVGAVKNAEDFILKDGKK